MAVFIVAYDLNTPGKTYSELIAEIKKLQNCKPQKSLWFVEWSGTRTALRDKLGAHIDSNDTLLVSQVFKQCWASSNMAACAGWLEARGL